MSASLKRAGVLVLAFVVSSGLFWALRGAAVQSGDYLEYQEQERYGKPVPIYHIREPGAVALWQALAWGTRGVRAQAAAGGSLNAEEREVGFDLLGALAGGFYVVFLICFIAEYAGSLALRIGAFGLVMVSSVTWLFVGHIEFYAPFAAGLMLFYWRAARYFRAPTQRNFFWLTIGALVAVTMHRAAIFHFPALLLVWRAPSGIRKWERPTAGQIRVILSVTIVACLLHIVPILIATLGESPILVFEDYNRLPELITPFTQSWAEHVRETSKLGAKPIFTFGSMEHWKHFFFFIAISAPLGVMVVAVKIRSLSRSDQRFFAASAVCALVWALFWHPHLGFGDWDLFSHPGLPINLLAAALILEAKEDSGSSGGAAPGA